MMKRLFNILLVVEAVVLILLSIFGGSLVDYLGVIFSFPFMQIGDVLREMSWSGTAGNVAAWCIYCGFCLIPVAVLVVKLVRRRFKPEDGLLLVISAVLFAVTYFLVNITSYTNQMVFSMTLDMSIPILGAVAYSVIVGYVVIKITRKVYSAEGGKLKHYLNVILFIVNMALVYNIFGEGLSGIMKELQPVELIYGWDVGAYRITQVMAVVEYVADVIVNLMTIVIIIMAQSLVSELDINKLSEKVIGKAKRISKFCVITIVAYVMLYIIFNVLQLIFMQKLYTINGTVSIPLVLIMAMMLFMIVARYIVDTKKIKDENDMFI